MLHIAYCLMLIAHCLLPMAYSLLHIAYCLLPIAYCLLPVGETRVLGVYPLFCVGSKSIADEKEDEQDDSPTGVLLNFIFGRLCKQAEANHSKRDNERQDIVS